MSDISLLSDDELIALSRPKQPTQQTDISSLSDDQLRALLAPPQPAPQTADAPPPEEVDDPNWLQENLGMPGGIGLGTVGSIGGGMIGGPPGAVVGGVVGGAIGDFAGTLYSELVYKETDIIDAYKLAVENALFSAGTDIATLGILSKIKPAYYLAKHKLGLTAEETAREIVDGVFGAGSRESLEATQKILEDGGATLLPSQIRSSGLDNFRESVASAGLISRGTIDRNVQDVNRAIKDGVSNIVNRNAGGTDASPAEMGNAFFTLINAGQDALQSTYVKGLGEIQASLGVGLTNRISTNQILKPLDAYIKSVKGVAVDKVQPQSLKFVEDQLGRLRELPGGAFPVSELVTLDKSFTQRITAQFGPTGETPNPQAAAELAEIATQLRTSIYNAMKNKNPEAAEKYKALKGAYGDGINALFPVINKSYIKAAKNGSYVALGNLAAKATNINQIKTLRTSLNTAFKEASKDPNAALPFASVKEIDELFKRGFLSSRVSSSLTETASVSGLKGLAKKLELPAEAEKYKYMLGADYPRFKQLMNAVLETSDSAAGDFGQLMLRSAEAGGIRNIASQLGSVVVGGGMGVAAAGAVSTGPVVLGGVAALFIPQVFAKIVTNPNYANRLLLLTKSKAGDLGYLNTAAQLLVADVIDNITVSERDAMVEYLSKVAKEAAVEKNENE